MDIHSYVHMLFKVRYSKVKGDPEKGNIDAIYQYLLHTAGPLATLPYQSGHFNAQNISDYPNYQRYFTRYFLSLFLPFYNRKLINTHISTHSSIRPKVSPGDRHLGTKTSSNFSQ